MKAIVRKAVYITFCVLLAGILAICVFANNISYATLKYPTTYEPAIMALGVTGVFLVSFICTWKHDCEEKRKNYVIWILSILFLLFQMYLIRCYYFKTDWDVRALWETAYGIANETAFDDYNLTYFSEFPNNLPLLYVFVHLIRFFQGIGRNPYYGILVVQCVISWVTGLLLYFTVRELLKSDRYAIFAWVLYILSVGLSPWTSVPYSDSFALVFPIAILYLYSTGKRRKKSGKILTWFLIGMLGMLGYRIKPQIFILVIAIAILHLTEFISQVSRYVRQRSWMKSFVACMFGISISLLCVNGCVRTLNLDINPEQEFGWTHFLMMGLNTGPRNGTYSPEDMDFSEDCIDKEDRHDKNLQEVRRRLEDMGPKGFLNLMHRKVLTNYNDGTFCWGGEGTFYIERYSKDESVFANFVRNVYYNGIWQGAYLEYFYYAELALWFGILFWSLGNIFSICEKNLQLQDIVTLAMLAIIGLTLFEQLFEPRARYFYTYAPLYITLAVSGLHTVRKKFP